TFVFIASISPWLYCPSNWLSVMVISVLLWVERRGLGGEMLFCPLHRAVEAGPLAADERCIGVLPTVANIDPYPAGKRPGLFVRRDDCRPVAADDFLGEHRF